MVQNGGVGAEEVKERQRRAVAAAADRGLDGLLVWSRMGTSLYWYGDVFYLTNHHGGAGDFQSTPFWSGHGYNAVVLPVDGDPVLVVDLPDCPRETVFVDDIRFSNHVPKMTAEVLREKGIYDGKLGLVGSETLLLSSKQHMEDALGAKLQFVPADDIVETLRMVKSDAEVAMMRNAISVGGECMGIMMDAVKAGVTEGEIVGEGFRAFVARDGLPADIAVTSGDRSHHYWRPQGPPHWDSSRLLVDGEPIHIDLWGPVGGYYTDFARSTAVGHKPTSEQNEVIDATIEAVEYVMKGLRPGVTVDDIYKRGEHWMTENGWSVGEGPLHEYVPIFGHGLGLACERPWIIAGESTVVEKNMIFAVELMLARGAIGACFEHDVLVTEDGYEVLDAECPARWDA